MSNTLARKKRASIGFTKRETEEIREFRTTPDYYYGGKVCRHKADKPCNPGCLLWRDCQYGKERTDG